MYGRQLQTFIYDIPNHITYDVHDRYHQSLSPQYVYVTCMSMYEQVYHLSKVYE